MNKINHVPFSVWYEIVLKLIEFIKNSDFDVIDQIESYSFNDISFCKKQDNYKFTSTNDGSKYRPVVTPTPIQALVPGYMITSYQPQLPVPDKFNVSVTTNRETILKIEVFETIGITDIQDPINTQVNHSIVFGKNNVLVDGVWYSNDTPDAFMHDINNEDVSVLELLNLINDLKFG